MLRVIVLFIFGLFILKCHGQNELIIHPDGRLIHCPNSIVGSNLKVKLLVTKQSITDCLKPALDDYMKHQYAKAYDFEALVDLNDVRNEIHSVLKTISDKKYTPFLTEEDRTKLAAALKARESDFPSGAIPMTYNTDDILSTEYEIRATFYKNSIPSAPVCTTLNIDHNLHNGVNSHIESSIDHTEAFDSVKVEVRKFNGLDKAKLQAYQGLSTDLLILSPKDVKGVKDVLRSYDKHYGYVRFDRPNFYDAVIAFKEDEVSRFSEKRMKSVDEKTFKAWLDLFFPDGDEKKKFYRTIILATCLDSKKSKKYTLDENFKKKFGTNLTAALKAFAKNELDVPTNPPALSESEFDRLFEKDEYKYFLEIKPILKKYSVRNDFDALYAYIKEHKRLEYLGYEFDLPEEVLFSLKQAITIFHKDSLETDFAFQITPPMLDKWRKKYQDEWLISSPGWSDLIFANSRRDALTGLLPPGNNPPNTKMNTSNLSKEDAQKRLEALNKIIDQAEFALDDSATENIKELLAYKSELEKAAAGSSSSGGTSSSANRFSRTKTFKDDYLNLIKLTPNNLIQHWADQRFENRDRKEREFLEPALVDIIVHNHTAQLDGSLNLTTTPNNNVQPRVNDFFGDILEKPADAGKEMIDSKQLDAAIENFMASYEAIEYFKHLIQTRMEMVYPLKKKDSSPTLQSSIITTRLLNPPLSVSYDYTAKGTDDGDKLFAGTFKYNKKYSLGYKIGAVYDWRREINYNFDNTTGTLSTSSAREGGEVAGFIQWYFCHKIDVRSKEWDWRPNLALGIPFSESILTTYYPCFGFEPKPGLAVHVGLSLGSRDRLVQDHFGDFSTETYWAFSNKPFVSLTLSPQLFQLFFTSRQNQSFNGLVSTLSGP